MNWHFEILFSVFGACLANAIYFSVLALIGWRKLSLVPVVFFVVLIGTALPLGLLNIGNYMNALEGSRNQYFVDHGETSIGRIVWEVPFAGRAWRNVEFACKDRHVHSVVVSTRIAPGFRAGSRSGSTVVRYLLADHQQIICGVSASGRASKQTSLPFDLAWPWVLSVIVWVLFPVLMVTGGKRNH